MAVAFGVPVGNFACSNNTVAKVSDYKLTTKSKVQKIDFKWEIPNFAHQFTESRTSIEGPVVRARTIDVFHAHAITEVRWKLQMVLDCDGFLCVEVKQWDTAKGSAENSKMQVQLNVCISVANNAKVFCIGFREVPCCFMKLGKGHSWKLIRQDVVLGDHHRYLGNAEQLTMLCTSHCLQPETCTYAVDQLEVPLPVVPPPVMGSGMGNVLAEGLFSDVTVVSDGRTFPAHRAVLAQRSEVFRKMFEVNMTEKCDRHVVIQDLSADAVSDLLTFIYTDSAPNIKEIAPELLAAAEKYNIPRLKAVCEEELAKSLDIDNVINRLIESEMYQASQLKDAALHWISKHAPDVVKTASWKPFCEQHPELVTAICEQFASYIQMLK